MSTSVTPSPDSKLWGIYYTDREYARVMGDPLRTVVEAPSKLAAEQALAETGLAGRWHLSQFVDSPDMRFREIVRLFAKGGFVESEKDEFYAGAI